MEAHFGHGEQFTLILLNRKSRNTPLPYRSPQIYWSRCPDA
jgi:hypothetical protein